MKKNNAPAFTLMEILIVVVIIAAMATMIGPRLVRREPSSEWRHIKAELNNLLYFARQEAISNQTNYRLTFFAQGREKNDTIVVENEILDPDPSTPKGGVYPEPSRRAETRKPRKKKFIPTHSEYFSGRYELPKTVKLHAVYKGKQEQLSENKNKAYCYVIPNGLVEDCMIHLLRTEHEGFSKVTFKVVPFFGTFEMLDEFVKPGAEVV